MNITFKEWNQNKIAGLFSTHMAAFPQFLNENFKMLKSFHCDTSQDN